MAEMIATSNPSVFFAPLTPEEEREHERARREKAEAWDRGVCPTVYLSLFHLASLVYSVKYLLGITRPII